MIRKYIYCLLTMVALSCFHVCAQSAFDASSIYFTSAEAKKKSIDLLGKSKNGVQIWYCNVSIGLISQPIIQVNSVYARDLTWMSEYVYPYNYGLCPEDETDDVEYRHGVTGEDVGHYFSIASETNVKYAAYRESTGELLYKSPDGEFNLAPHTSLEANEPVFDEADGQYKQTLKWNVDNLTDVTLSKMMLFYSYDGGKQWAKMATVEDDVKACDSVTISIPRQFDQIKYFVAFAPQDKFKMLIDNNSGLTSNQTENFKLGHLSIPCEFSVSGVKSIFKDAEKIYDRKYQPTAEWKVADAYSSVFGSAELQYSLLADDDEWHTILTTDQASGSQRVDVPVGNYLYYFRMVIKPKDGMEQMCDSTVTNKVVRVSYFSSPAYNCLAIKENLSDTYDSTTDMLTPTFSYDLYDDLYENRIGKASVSYSTDGGNTWTLATTVDGLKKEGEVKLSVPAKDADYLFRMNMACSINGVITPNKSQTTKAYTFKKPEDVKTITLKDSEAYTAQSLMSGNVNVTRSFVSGRMGTVCLPFALTSAQIAEGFGENVEVYEYTSLSGSTMNFTKVTAMEAGKAYLVKTAENKESLSFTGVNINEDVQPQPSTIDNYTFKGTFGPYSMATDQTELFLATNGTLKYPSSSDNNANLLGGYRGFFCLPGGSATSAKISFDGTMTGIADIVIDGNQPMKVYNLNGQYVGDNLKALPKGIYVANGKKVVIK